MAAPWTTTAPAADRFGTLDQLLIRSAPHTFGQWASTPNTPNATPEWVAARHLVYISKQITRALAAGNGRIIVNMPPRHGKSFLISKWVPVWLLDNWPHTQIIMTSYGDEMAQRNGRMVRDEFATNPKLSTKLREDVQSVGTFYTQQGGAMVSAGKGGKIMGKGFNVGIIDDIIKDWAEANSAVSREADINWFEGTFMSRCEPNASIIILMHRWHVDDLCGYLQKTYPGKWQVLALPALAGPGDLLGRRGPTPQELADHPDGDYRGTQAEPLWPERIPITQYEGVRKEDFVSLFQQMPSAEMAGRAYHRYTDRLNLDPHLTVFAPALPLGLTLDFNVNPGMHLETFQYDPHADEFRFYFETHGPRLKTQPALEMWWKQLTARTGGTFPFPCLHVFGDRSGKTENTTTALTDYMLIERFLRDKKVPYQFYIPAHNPPRKDRADTVNEALCDDAGEPHAKVHPDCVRLVEDLRTQPTDEDGLPENKAGSLLGHAADAAGYAVYFLRPILQTGFPPQRAVY